jgi:hypothetical protein
MIRLIKNARRALALVAMFTVAAVQAQTADVPTLRAGQQLSLVTMTALSSKTHAKGDFVVLKTAFPIVINTNLTIPAGTPATGQIDEARQTAIMGQSGKLVLKPLYVTLASGQIIRVAGGVSNKGKIAAEAVVGLAFLAVFSGKSANIPAGTQVDSHVLHDVVLR